MTDQIDSFFAAWGEADAGKRRDGLRAAMAPAFSYTDPRSDGPITDLDALDAYIAQFTASAPGWQARVAERQAVGDETHAQVDFSGPDGKGGTMTQMGRYSIARDDEGRITCMSGVAEGQQ